MAVVLVMMQRRRLVPLEEYNKADRLTHGRDIMGTKWTVQRALNSDFSIFLMHAKL